MAKVKLLICPYCGETQPQVDRCRACGGLLEPLSRQATHNAMGPWFVRDPNRPHQPGCSYETLIGLLERGQVSKLTIIRGPTTKQFWTIAKRVPGVAHLLGYCHNCDASVDPGDHGCHACGVPFGAYLDRNYLGLPDIRSLPWEAQLEENEAARFLGRSLQYSHTSQSGGLSSFASDEEILSEIEESAAMARSSGSSPSRATHAGPGSEGAPAPPAATSSQTGGTVFDDYAQNAVARSLQRKVADQKRTIRVLAAAIVIVGVVAAVVVISTRGGGSAPDGAADGAQRVAKEDGTAASTGDGAGVELDTTSSTQSPAGTVVSPPPTELDPKTEVVDSPPPDPRAQHPIALQLIKAAQELDRPIKDRIKDYEEAIRILQAINAAPADPADPADEKPAGLLDIIEQASKALELLRLEDFFP